MVPSLAGAFAIVRADDGVAGAPGGELGPRGARDCVPGDVSENERPPQHDTAASSLRSEQWQNRRDESSQVQSLAKNRRHCVAPHGHYFKAPGPTPTPRATDGGGQEEGAHRPSSALFGWQATATKIDRPIDDLRGSQPASRMERMLP
jgi:hypothetical protein